MNKKLIEVALPLDTINTEAAREKSIRHGHPSTLHLWWARRPLAAARAVIWSSLVDDPSSHPEQFPTEEAQNDERRRLFKILEDLVVWENSNNEEVLKAAKNEIMRSTNGNPPTFLDPFAGGGAIPLEAQRLGLEAHAHDLNPVAVMINKAMIEIPPKFANMPPVNPDDRVSRANDTWKGAQGLAADVKYYGDWMKKEAFKRIGYMYPKVKVPKEQGGGEATVIAWLWARTVKCPNPACGCEMPLVKSFDLSRKKGAEAHIKPTVRNGKINFTVIHSKADNSDGTVNRRGAHCINCGTPVGFPYIREEGKNGRIYSKLMAIVAEKNKKRIYLPPCEEHASFGEMGRPENYPSVALPYNPRNFQTPNYGMTTTADLFTNRQLTAMTTFSDLVKEAQLLSESDAIKNGLSNDSIPLSKGGCGAKGYGQAIGVYLAFGVSRLSDICNSLCRWESSKTQVRNLFGRQAIPMLWDYAENNVFAGAAGDYSVSLNSIVKVLERFNSERTGFAEQFDAQSDNGLSNVMVSTDPPYYNNIVYADLADFFYVWMRRSLKETFPSLFQTMMVPKAEELVATPYRFEGDEEAAKSFFEKGMLLACKEINRSSIDSVPVTIFYAYKQKEIEDDEYSGQRISTSGWETMLTAIIQAGFSITGTWPMRTELANRPVSSGSNALASSIVLVCRKRLKDAPQTTRRNLVNMLRRDLRPALKKLQDSNIAPVDLAQSAIGPGMAVYSRYRRVLEADGTPMSVRTALQVINEEIDLYFNEQVGEMDSTSRFCIDLYTQSAFNDMKFGDADILARAKGTSVAAIASHNVVYAKAGIVHLLERTDLPETIDKDESCIWLLTLQLTQIMATGGVEACAKAVFTLFGSNAERAKDLAYRLYTIAEQKKWASEAYAYNALVVAWPDIQSRAAMMQRETPDQMDMFSMGLLNS